MRPLLRAVLIAAMIVAVVAMGAHYDTARDEHWPYPTPADLATDYSGNVGETVLLWAEVEQVDDRTQTARVHVPGTSLSLTIDEFDAAVEPGGTVQVYGTLQPDHVVTANRVVVVNPEAGSDRDKYAVSAVGAALFVVLFFRYWRVSLDTLSLEAR